MTLQVNHNRKTITLSIGKIEKQIILVKIISDDYLIIYKKTLYIQRI